MKRKVTFMKRLVKGSSAFLILFLLASCGQKQAKIQNDSEVSSELSYETQQPIEENDFPSQEPIKEGTLEVSNKEDNQEKKKIEITKRTELEKTYKYVSSPTTLNNKRYFRVRKNASGYGLVDAETLEEVIPADKYDFISNEIEFNGYKYVWVSNYQDEGYANGLVSLDTFEEVLPCETYRIVKVKQEENGLDILECLNKDRVTTDIYDLAEEGPKLVKRVKN